MTLYTIMERRGTAADWALANTVLEEGQWAAELDTGKAKLGDGATAYNDLPYFIPEDQVAALIDAAVSASSVNAQTGTTYTLVLADAGNWVTMNNAGASTLTIPPNASVAFPIGTVIEGAQLGAGQVTIVGGSGVTVNGDPGLKIAAQYGVFGLKKIGTNTWVAYGRLSA